MARFQFQGIDDYAAKLYALSDQSETMIKRAVYDGAKVVIDEIKSAIAMLPAQAENPKKGEMFTLLEAERDGLIEGAGLSEMKNEKGYINTKFGFAGYNRLKSKKYPKGHPNVMIARAIESGTSFRRKTRFIQKAAKAATKAAEAAMAARFDEDTKEIMQ